MRKYRINCGLEAGVAALKGLDGSLGSGAGWGDVEGGGMMLNHGRPPVAGYFPFQPLIGGLGSKGQGAAKEEPGGGSGEDDEADGEQTFEGHGWGWVEGYSLRPRRW